MPYSKLPYFNCCVNWEAMAPLDDLNEIIDRSRQITRQTFLQHVSKEDMASLNAQFGYKKIGLKMKDDWHVTYHRCRLRGCWVYYVQHSCIEYVFAESSLFHASVA
jgi:hypothetical protein